MSDIPNCIASPQTNPLRNGTVLLLRFGELLLRAMGFVALLRVSLSAVVPSIEAIFIRPCDRYMFQMLLKEAK